MNRHSSADYTVRAVHCDHRASDEEVYNALCRATEPLSRSWEQLARAGKIVIKPNMKWPPSKVAYFEGRRRELVDDAVLRATLRLLRAHTSAELIVIDDTSPRRAGDEGVPPDLNYAPMLEEFGAEYVGASDLPLAWREVPGRGMMFSRYLLNTHLVDADAIVSVAKMKSHAFMGVTLCLKNLFGLPPMLPHGKPRTYFHHIIRLPYVLPDLGLLTQPCLNIIDGLTGQSVREWGGEGRICDILVAGDHAVATDACGAWLMGHDPASDWPTPPFRRDRNALLVAAEHGFGTVDLNEIGFETEVARHSGAFDSMATDADETVLSWRRTTCEQGLFYRDHCRELIGRYAGEYIFLQDGEVVWHGLDPVNLGSRRDLSGEKRESALWLKLVDPNGVEGEHFEVYEEALRALSLCGDRERSTGSD